MGIFDRKPTTLENLRAAQADLERVKSTAPQALLQATQAVGRKVGTGADWHPSLDHADQLIAEAELRLAEASVAYATTEPEGLQLCSAVDAALVGVRDQLALIKDDPEPTLASTPEAKAEYEENCAKQAEALKANGSSRLSIIGSAALRIGKAAVASPKMLDELSATIADAKSQLAAVVDPEAPVLGAVSPVTVAALSRALAAHRIHVEANEKKRENICQDLLPVLRAINAGFVALGKKRREQGLPSVELFRGSFEGINRPNLEHLAGLAAGGDLTPERCDRYRACIGCSPANTEGPKAKLREIADRRRTYEKHQAEKAEVAKRNNGRFFGHGPEVQ